ncbi:P-loop containing nucleoside triphosphate hydrolase protein [Hymenopellis radicata]|nr:P-loop containing nucleoside triphosphate hydrolase protein [Hymenopellis radicata]
MPKRRATADSDDEGSVISSPASKRARTEEYDDDDSQQERKPTRKGKAAARRQVADDDDEDLDADQDVEMNGDDGDDDEEFENRYTKTVLEAMAAKRNVAGGIAEHGIIESIEMHQFMCHKYLTFSFGPQINFIIGHNGSGKSAVLSAITVALGGKANSTGRANGLKSFIREGQSVAEVTIQIKNQGEEAYKPKEYGKSIVITRKFTKDGSSSWKIKSKDGRLISSKKEELAAICDHMNIQVDNPMNVLTQDAARQFLSASHPSDKYKFFLRGTQLSQLSEEYTTCLENIDHTTKVLNQKKEALPDLRVSYKEALSRYEEASKARDQKKKVDELKKELAWSFVHDKGNQLQDAVDAAAKQERRLPKVEEGLQAAEALFESESNAVTTAEEAYSTLNGVDDLNNQKRDLTDKMRKNRAVLNELSSERKAMDDSFRSTKVTIADIQRQIDFENRRLASDTQAKRDESRRQVDEANERLKAAKDSLPEILQKMREADAKVQEVKQTGEAKEAELKTARESVQHDQHMIRQANDQESDRYVAYGRNMPQLLERIKRQKWYGEMPLGPLGVHVKCKDPEQWGELLRKQLGNMLTAFSVTDPRDNRILKDMLKSSGNENLLVIITERDMFDFSSGEPPSHMLTVLRALEISDPFVLRILINQSRIEKMFLAKTRREGEEMMRSYGRAGTAWTADGFLLRRFPEGGESTSPLGKARNDNTSQLLTGRDSAAQRRHFNEKMKNDEAEVQRIQAEVRELKTKYMTVRGELDTLKTAEKRAHTTVNQAQNKLRQLEDAAQEDMPANVAGLEAARKDAEAEKENIEKQFVDHNQRKTEIENEQKGYQTKLDEVRAQLSDHDEYRRQLQDNVEKAAERRLKANHELKYMQGKLDEERTKLTEFQNTASVIQEEFEVWTTKALEFCPRVETHRSHEEIQRNLDSTNAALKEREKRQGATVEEILEELNKAKAVLQTAEQEWRHMVKLNKQLKSSLMTRLARWQEFRRHIALRCKLVFQFNLSHRGYYGKVLFDHDKGTLQLKVQTDDVAATQGGSRDKDPRSLSGGEKSFSTICFYRLPLRCLDEFDVFMDAVNRRISMKMMIETANQSDKKQYVLITPQDMNNITVGNSVRVHRMTDPERGQGTLAFSG